MIEGGEMVAEAATPGGRDHRFTRHGGVRVADCGTHLSHADGTPFFYLADTAWNGALLSSEPDWAAYLNDRKTKGFTAIQFIVMAPWGAAYTDAEGRTAFSADDPSHVNPDFFERIDARLAAINAAGLLAVPVLAWAAKFGDSARHNPGAAFRERLIESLVRYQVDRCRAHHVLWLLAGDGRYDGLRSWKWKRIGRKVFGDPAIARAPVGMHPMGKTWPYGSFRREKWLNLLGYQSSHSDDPATMRWLLRGPPAEAWREERKPIINLEPCYEGIRNWATSGKTITNIGVRRAMYGSLLNAPTAGVTYGAHGVWSWEKEAREPLNHAGSGVARPWNEAAQFPGSFDVQRLASLFTSIDWWRLRPAPELLRVQPGEREISRFVSAAAADTRDLAVFYLPTGGEISLHSSGLPCSDAFWFDPRTGSRQTANMGADGAAAAPDLNDWVLVLR